MADAQSRVHLPKHEDVVWEVWSAPSGASILNQPYSSGHLAGSPQCCFGLFLFAKSTNTDRSWTKTLPLGVIVVVCLPGDVYAHLGGFLYGF